MCNIIYYLFWYKSSHNVILFILDTIKIVS